MQPVAVMVSYRLGGADGVAVEARKWEWALHELGFRVRRVAGEFDDGLRPTTPGCRSSPSIPSTGARPIPARSARRSPAPTSSSSRTCARCPINPDASTLTAECWPNTTGRWCSTTTTFPGNGPGSPPLPASHRTGRTRCTSRSTTTRGSSSSTAGSKPSRFATRSISIRHAAIVTRRARPFGFAADDLVLLQPSRAIPRKNVPAAVEFATELAALEARDRASVDHRSRGRRLRHRVRSHPRRRDHPDHRRSRARRLPTHTPRPIWSCIRRPGRASATP